MLSVLVMISIGYYSWKRNKRYVSAALFPVTIYAFGYAFEMLCTSIEGVKFWIKVEYLGIPFLGVFWLIAVLNFNGDKEKIKKGYLRLLYVIPVITVIMNYTNDFHHLFYKKLYMDTHGPFPIVGIIEGLWYWVNVSYTYALMFLGLIILIRAYLKAISIIRKQILLSIIAWVIPWVSDVIYMLRLMPFNLDLCPLALSISGVMFSLVILRFKFLRLTSIALEKIFSNMSDGVIIIDSENNIINFNNKSKNIMPELKDIELGDNKIDEVLNKYETVRDSVNNSSYNESLISIKDKGKLRYYKMNINNIYENTDGVIGGIIGKILMLNDITEIKQHQEILSDNLNFLQTLMDAIPNPIYSKDENGIYNHCNIAFTEYLGLKKEEFIGNTVYDIFEEKLADIYYKSDKSLMEKKGTQVYEEKLMHNDGTHHDAIFSKSVIVNQDGSVKGLVGVIIDITEQKKNREKIDKLLKLKEVMVKIGYSINEISNINDLLQLVLDEVINCVDERSCGSVLILDKNNNLKIAASKGYKPREVEIFAIKLENAWLNNGEDINKTVIFNDIDKMKVKNMLDTAEGMKIKSTISSPIIIDNQLYGILNIDSMYNNIFDEGDLELMEYMRNQASIAIIKHKLYEETVYLSRYDKLTNVYNRSYFEQLVYTDIYNDNTEKKEFFVAVLDLNGLKFVNDNYGHLVGDELIKTFSRGLRSLTKSSDVIGRLGGDEFVGVFFNVDSQDLINRFEELIEYFKNNPIIFEEKEIICSYSYGIVNFPREGREFNQLIKIADERMYEYKRIVKGKKEVTREELEHKRII